MSGPEVGSYQELAFDPVYYEQPCPICGGGVDETDDGYECQDCGWETEKEINDGP